METMMNTQADKEQQQEITEDGMTPANPTDIPDKSQQPDPDRTIPGTLPSVIEEITEPLPESTFSGEHDISRDHSEPTGVTGTTNDNAIDGEYIDVGGGD
jgi:hypothetical protein